MSSIRRMENPSGRAALAGKLRPPTRSSGRFAALQIEGNRVTNELLQGNGVDRVTFLDVDRPSALPIKAGVDEACWVLQSGVLENVNLTMFVYL